MQRGEPWSPLTVDAIREVFRTAPFRWFVAGAHALERALGTSWRTHEDLDVGICRKDRNAVFHYLSDWDLHVAATGGLSRWEGRPLPEQRQENNIWARRSAHEPWAFDITIGGGNDEVWWSRREPFIRLPWADAVQHKDGVPFLAPQVQTADEVEGRPPQGRPRCGGRHPRADALPTRLAVRSSAA